MKTKQMVFVVIAFVILGAIYLFQQKQRPQATRGLGLESVAGADLSVSDIHGIRCYLGSQPEQAVHLIKQGDQWRVHSRFDAPADQTKISQLLDKLANLKGELRSSSPEVLADFEIDDDKAVHLVLLNDASEEIKHILLGKEAPGYQESFLRLQGSHDVYLANVNLRSPLGLYGTRNETPPDSKTWVDLTLMKIAAEDIERFEINTPYRRLVLEKRPEPLPEVEEATGEETTPPRAPLMKWAFVEPPLEAEPKQSGISRFTGAMSNVNVTDVVARGDLEKYGLMEPLATCTVVDIATREYRLRFGNPVPGVPGAHYVCKEGDELVYQMDRWKLEAILVGMSYLVDLPSVTIPKDDVQSVGIARGGRSLELVREDGQWKVLPPVDDVELKTDRVERILSALSALRLQDQATITTADVTQLDQPVAVVTALLKNGERRRFTFGREVPLTDGARFVQIGDSPEVYTVSKVSYTDMIPASSELFDLKLLDFATSDVTALTVRDSSGEVSLALVSPAQPEDATGEPAEPYWVIRGQETGVEQANVMALLTILSPLTATDFVPLGAGGDIGQPAWSATVRTEGGAESQLTIGTNGTPEGSYARVKGKKPTFIIASGQVEQLQQLSQKLRP